ncbi:hypothetical protein [Bordetella hinzii]|uniref:hypothetical protein n=1 Tax=Bordetella hinzii TaxID=103855 RepID=UPI0003FAE45A|nr:hypothetical protein [Bordetella hinzii]AKQ56361.1 hypothetical protein ACR54_03058 [Bordetella hinzii]KCB32362.1 hypothetical protein L541_2852 [Bordetella hinzii CA90 BAL1384]KCB33498.1 hypothetical protein L543_3450 [Bordetella hinzii L60]MCJ9711993.1 hypothetical protein [Bordetella hinzii]QDJ33593.1 hypothetical protein CBR68_15325 [Bordetella hinzii]
MTTVSLSADALLAPAAQRPCPPPRASRKPAWPFPAPAVPVPVDAGRSTGAQGDAQAKEMRRRMVWDVVMVLSWGALIPGLMWLGAAAGF